jgi:Enoyl-CoA hydratase/isomerase
MTDPAPLLPALPDSFDGFRLELDPARERADVILDRAPLNIITMAEREELRAVFEALDADARVRVILLRAAGEHFSSGGEIGGFLDASPEHVSRLAWNVGAPARCRKPVIAATRGYCWSWTTTDRSPPKSGFAFAGTTIFPKLACRIFGRLWLRLRFLWRHGRPRHRGDPYRATRPAFVTPPGQARHRPEFILGRAQRGPVGRCNG